MCYYFSKTKSVCEAGIRLEEESRETGRHERLRMFSVDGDAEKDPSEFREIRNFLKNFDRQQ